MANQKVSVDLFEQGSDNWGYILSNAQNEALVIDPLDAGKYTERLQAKGLSCQGILITHYHSDHTAGVDELLRFAKVPVWGPQLNEAAPTFVDHHVSEETHFTIGSFDVEVFLLPGHATDLAAFKIRKRAFVGDLIFNLGCGRAQSGGHRDLFDSLQRLKDLPVDTELYVGHDYRKKNLAFAKHIDPNYYAALSLGDLGKSTSLEMELWWNPFLRISHFSDWKQLRDMRDQF